jgi:hypothetical protein
MSKLEADSRISFPRPLVFSTYRDRLPQLVPHLPDIKEIVVQSRSDDAGVTKLLNLWVSSAKIPLLARAVIKPEMLRWDDHATWNENEWTVDWTVKTKVFTDNIKCSGKNKFVEEGSSTILQIRGDLTISGLSVAGEMVEKFVVPLLKQNVLAVAGGVQKFLEAETRKNQGR